MLAAALALALAAPALAAPAASGAAPQAVAGKRACNSADALPSEVPTRTVGRAVRCLINAERAVHGLTRLDSDPRLDRAAAAHNRLMVRSGCFAHQCPGESILGDRIDGTGYLDGAGIWAYGEVVAWGAGRRGTAAKIVSAWMASPGHRAAILEPGFRELGVAVARRGPGGQRDAATHTVNFGARRG